MIFGLLMVELALRWSFPDSLMGAGANMQFAAGGQKQFVADAESGYLPVLDGIHYDDYGCRLEQGQQPDGYRAEDPQGRQRILFAGDSVTRRETLMRALQELYGNERYEYWNAGVESFNLQQEWVLYRRYNHRLKPDQVVLTFHNNDFQETPLVYHKDGKLQILFLRKDHSMLNAWWFEHSYLYRWLMGIELGNLERQRRKESARVALEQWKTGLQQDQVRFSVVLLPILKPLDQWTNRERWSRATALELLEALSIETYDLLPALEEALRDGLNVQEAPGDSWHPSAEVARVFAQLLENQGLLEKKPE